jgi:sterol desaturase/sphingolipid hydroxylase (fatty acid hydroxylase superfamily)
VFTTPLAWAPGILAFWLVLAALVGGGAAALLSAGLLAGFLRYEYVHYRIHFAPPRSARAELLRVHHLAHHHCNPAAYHGVTTRFWDRVFGTLPAEHARDYASVRERPPLEGKSNFGNLWPTELES